MNTQKSSGFLVLFDIKDSTARKAKCGDTWLGATLKIYDLFQQFALRLAKQVSAPVSPNLVTKDDGDLVMGFFVQQNPDHALAVKFFDNVLRFRDEVHDGGDGNICNSIRLNVVAAYIDDVHIIKEGRDILGRELDFVFRLEKFSDVTHIVINNSLAKLLECDKTNIYKGFDVIACHRALKGFDGVSEFFVITSLDMVKEELESIKPSPHDAEVVTDMFVHFMDKYVELFTANHVKDAIAKMAKDPEGE